jgi:hypothetical protein
MIPSPAFRGDRYRAFLEVHSTGQAGKFEQPSIELWQPKAGSAQRPGSRGHHYWPVTILGAIVMGALALTAVWVFLVPIDQAPDEPGHWDYALCLWEHGRIYRAAAARNEHHPSGSVAVSLVHPQGRHLWFASEGNVTFQSPATKAPADYGTPEFFARLNRTAPDRASGDYRMAPTYVPIYTYGYYGLLALWIGMVRRLTGNIVTLFFASRLFNTALLGPTLILCYGIMRELRFKAAYALMLTALVGFFPMTTFVAAYIQPDNLALTLVSLCWYLALVSRRKRDDMRLLACLGIALGALLVTKQHFYLCCFFTIGPMLAVAGWRQRWSWRRWLAAAACLIGPSIGFASVYVWSIWGTTPCYSQGSDYERPMLLALAERFERAFLDYYSGTTHQSFYGIFGCLDTPLVIGSRRTTRAIMLLVQPVSYLVILLTLWRLEQVGSRLIGVWRSGRRSMAISMACSNPAVNSYFLFTVFMFAFYIRTDNIFGAQGRNWIPFMLPIFLTSLAYAPKALTLRSVRTLAGGALTAGLIAFTVLGAIYGPRTIAHRYYSSGQAPSVATMMRTTMAPLWTRD